MGEENDPAYWGGYTSDDLTKERIGDFTQDFACMNAIPRRKRTMIDACAGRRYRPDTALVYDSTFQCADLAFRATEDAVHVQKANDRVDRLLRAAGVYLFRRVGV